jgi:hypothetical protein
MIAAGLRFSSHPELPMHSATNTSKWTLFFLSACVPGAGQLAARSWTCLAWFAAAGLLVAALTQLPSPLRVAMGIAFGLLCAEHAKRLVERRRAKGTSAVVAASLCHAQSRGRMLDIEFSLDVARSAADLWQFISNLPQFLTIDPFHDAVTLMRDRPARGVDLVLSHNAFGRRFLRFGRIVAWREGSGYTFSDLSGRDRRRGFPHVFVVSLTPFSASSNPEPEPEAKADRRIPCASGCGLNEESTSRVPLTRLSIRVRGRWTSRIAPVWIGRLWVGLVCREHARLLRKAL